MAYPIDFPESNLNLSVCEEHAKQGVEPMKAAFAQFPNGTQGVLECWRLSWKERLGALFLGRVWVSLMVGRTHVPPVSVWVERSPFPKGGDNGNA